MSEVKKYPGQLVFGLDIGTRSIVGTVGYRVGEKFFVVGQSIREHKTRAMLDGQIHDTDRSDFLHRYLLALCRGCERADVRGFFHWSLTDNFEWHSGYAERFGLIYVDYPTQKRILKDSARWFAQTARENGRNPELFFVYSGAVSAPLVFCPDPNRDPNAEKSGGIKIEQFFSADHLLKSSLSLFHTAQILHLIRHRKHAVSRAKILCYSYRMRKH